MGCVDTTPGPEPGDGDTEPAGSSAPTGPDGGGGEGGDTEDGAVDDADGGDHEPLPFQQWMKRSATGAVLSGIALGLQQIFEPKRELPAFVMEAPDAPHDPDAPFTLHFDPDDPTKTVAVVRAPADADPTPEPPRGGPGGG